MTSRKMRGSAMGPYAATADTLWQSRRKIGLTQKEAANALQISLRELRRIENGLYLPDATLQKALANLLAVPEDVLFAEVPQNEAVAGTRRKGSRVAGNPIDRHVGNRLFMRRVERGFSQERLAEILGVSFQQVQKYERGINRISASRLYDICLALNVELNFFFEDMPGQVRAQSGTSHHAWHDEPVSYEADRTESKELAELLGAFRQIPSTELRRGLIDLARAIAKLNSAASDANTGEDSKRT
ncbi:helix-turn-helix domain-containing protein [Limibacillus halophilus]|uniref:Transcriptional regulator with XRE-family HTH domain n=1 Tax=Limibacillus halophilus TaxID=1579333 RepID=A0A839SVN8_9PROT|nr:helix-turn-helix domain-containing protein [Limibacillus halophilus]MBB3066542.1 transcriptional regulator with XRE-family HTH domain [Limibacillus halophilus]